MGMVMDGMDEIIAEAIKREQEIADDVAKALGDYPCERAECWACSPSADEAAGLVPLYGPPPAERVVPPLPWSAYAAMLRGL